MFLLVLLVLANAYFLVTWVRTAGPSLVQFVRKTVGYLLRRKQVYAEENSVQAEEDVSEQPSRISGLSYSVIAPPSVSKDLSHSVL